MITAYKTERGELLGPRSYLDSNGATVETFEFVDPTSPEGKLLERYARPLPPRLEPLVEQIRANA